MGLKNKEIWIIAGVEVLAGLVESVVIPNFGRAKGEGFILPSKANLLTSTAILAGTGVLAGIVADNLLDKFNATTRTQRILIIAGSAIAMNAVEAVLVDNIIKHKVAIDNWEFPSLTKFVSNFGFLAITGLCVGVFSDQLIMANVNAEVSSLPNNNFLVDADSPQLK